MTQPAAFRTLHGPAQWTVALLAATIPLELAGLAVALVWRTHALETPTAVAGLARSDLLGIVVGVFGTLVLVATAVLFLVWFHRAAANLPALGRPDARFGPGWAIGAWFVPILNLFRPRRIAADIAKASLPHLAPRAHWVAFPPPAVVNWWWGFWVTSELLARPIVRLNEASPALVWLEPAVAVTSIVAAVLAIAVVTRITADQAALAWRVTHEYAARTAASAGAHHLEVEPPP